MTDVEQLLHTLCGDILADVDPLTQYARLTDAQAVYTELVSAIRTRRGAALRAMADAGMSYDQIARATGLGGKQRVSQLIAPAG